MGSHEIRVSDRASSIEYAIRDVVVPATKLEQEGHEIIKLNIGDPLAYPGLPTPKHMVDAFRKSLEQQEENESAAFWLASGRESLSHTSAACNTIFWALRIENFKKGLHVLIASPGFTSSSIRENALNSSGGSQKESPRNEKKMMSSEEVALKIVDAVGKRRRSIVLTSQGKLVVFLNKFFPSLVDRLVFNSLSKEKNSPF